MKTISYLLITFIGMLIGCHAESQTPALVLPNHNAAFAEKVSVKDFGILGQFAHSASRQSAGEIDATLNSVKKRHSHPLYVMNYTGDYEIEPDKLWRNDADAEPLPDFGCSLFYHFKTNAPIVGRNFDWQSQPALCLITRPPNRYASVSIVDTTYLGFSLDDLEKFDHAASRSALIEATQIPLDGMNEHGLAIGIAVVPATPAVDDPAIPNCHALHLVRLVLDTARNVAEAKSIFEKYEIVFDGAPHVHFLLGDESGRSMIVEIKNGQMVFLENDSAAAGNNNWQAATNFYLAGQNKPAAQCPRFARIKSAFLDAADTPVIPMKLLADVANKTTQWSAIYNLKQKQLTLVMSRDYENPLTIELNNTNYP